MRLIPGKVLLVHEQSVAPFDIASTFISEARGGTAKCGPITFHGITPYSTLRAKHAGYWFIKKLEATGFRYINSRARTRPSPEKPSRTMSLWGESSRTRILRLLPSNLGFNVSPNGTPQDSLTMPRLSITKSQFQLTRMLRTFS